ncbi:mannose-1-phosphate guanylyltransferase [Notoacmeibacter marinus]|uniref:mannose-1-phosphate guanylyltransferase n=1 Tax=Notoacmeibacter marinus TaxID=1876515 RepID=A0A231UU21_9HYPH|nr:AGE family epimerase/isomerase [Notoacmeibacter marinus]OXS99403.1 mannose-1-phosphate guanylyltransferase [Notoacmeibacter marinus]
MNAPIACFVMSGGIGSRLWPLSREDNPKQFHDLAGNGSMLMSTVRRSLARTAGSSSVYLIGSERHAARVADELAAVDLRGGQAVFEPVGRNTAPAVALAAQIVLDGEEDGLCLVMPSDHVIETTEQFWQTVEDGVDAAESGQIVVFGIRPTAPETGFGYIEVGDFGTGAARNVKRFVEKPDEATAKTYLANGNFFWNAGIFLFRASVMREAFETHRPKMWADVARAYGRRRAQDGALYLPEEIYETIEDDSIDYAIMERFDRIALVEAGFRWNDLGSWSALLDVAATDDRGNVVAGDVIAIDCDHCYLRSQGRLVSAVGLKDTAVIATADAIFVAPVSESQNVKTVVSELERSGRLEARFTPTPDRVIEAGAHRRRVRQWLFEETLPLWSHQGVDRRHGGFHESLTFDGEPTGKNKRMRTMARQTYAFCVAHGEGWDGPAADLIDHGIAFMKRGRTDRGGWCAVLAPDGTVVDPTEDFYDTAFVLFALAHAHRCGHPDAFALGQETFAFVDTYLEDNSLRGFLEEPGGKRVRRSNPHMHMLEALLAWYEATGERTYLRRASRIVDLFRNAFFDKESWTLGEYFDDDWQPVDGDQGLWTEPGHHFEWSWLLIQFANASGQHDLREMARRLYATGSAYGLNRWTGLAYNAVSRHGVPFDRNSRSWPQTEIIKAAIALDESGPPDMRPEIEDRVARLFRWHLDPAPRGMWVDTISEKGQPIAQDVPASIFYHLLSALMLYLGPKARPDA